jgi:hypothetical protein
MVGLGALLRKLYKYIGIQGKYKKDIQFSSFWRDVCDEEKAKALAPCFNAKHFLFVTDILATGVTL